MTVAITPNMTELYDGDVTTGWSPIPGTNSVDKLEGTNCLADQAKSTTGSIFLYTLASAIDMSDKFIVATMKINGVADTIANGGYRIYIEDSSTNQSYWYVGGNDTHSGGWGYFAIDPSTTPEAGNADETDILKIGVQFKTLTSVVGTADNCFWDIAHYGTGLTVTSAASETGGSGTSGATGWDDIFNYDTGSNPHYYGVVQKINGVYFLRGKLIFGNSASTLSIDFDDDALMGFQPDPHMTDALSGIEILGNATGSTNVNIPNSVLFSTVRNWEFTNTDADIDVVELPSTTVQSLSASDISEGEYIGTAFDTCEQLTVDTAILTDAIIRNSPSTSAALLYPTGTDNLSGISFISAGTGHAILIDTVGTYTFDAHVFDGYASTDGVTGNECVYNNSAGAVTINITNGGDTPTIHNGTSASTTVNNAVWITVNVKDIAGDPILNAQTAVYGSGGASLMNEDTTASGIAQETYNYVSDKDIAFKVRKSSTGSTRYVPVKGVGTISNAGFTVTVVMYEDTNIQVV